MSFSRLLAGFACIAVSVCAVARSPGADEGAGPRILPQWTAETQQAWWQRHSTPAQWDVEARRIHGALIDMQSRNGLAWAMSNPDFIAWVRHLHWLTLFPEDGQEHAYFRGSVHQRVFRTLGMEPELPRLLLSALRPEDDSASALEILCRTYRREPADVREYAALAVAMAVVFDQPLPAGWPHPYVGEEDLKPVLSDPWIRFESLVSAHRRGVLLVDPRGLGVRELTFAVDSRLAAREVRFARQLGLRGVERLPELYDAVEYDSDRIRQADYVWPYGSYQLQAIAKRGGICADRAFFTSEIGKVYGIPTIMFLGQGRNGTHAWVGFRDEPGHWSIDVARYQSDTLPMGRAFDPQTRNSITDADLRALVREDGRGTASESAAAMVEWARMNPASTFYRDLLVMARRRSPEWVEPWRLEARWLEDMSAPLDQREAFWRAWIAAYQADWGLTFEGKKRLLSVLEAAGAPAAAEQLREEILTENRWKRFDLAIGLAADEVLDLAERREWPRAEDAFEGAMQRFRAQSGGHLFYNLLLPYVQLSVQHGRLDLASRATRYLSGEYFPVRDGTILDNDIQLLKRQIQALHVAKRDT